MQNAGIAHLRLNWKYLAFDVHPDHLEAAIAGAKAMKFVGLNLTLPHKLLALKMVDELDETGKSCGAINTIRFEARDESGAWRSLGLLRQDVVGEIRSVGFNTDADAIVRSLRADLQVEPHGATILLLGAGGAGFVTALRLAQEGAQELFLVNRTRAKSEEMAQLIRERFAGTRVTIGYPKGKVDLAVNATSLGLKADDPLPFDAQQLSLGNMGAVYDMIYRPAETPLLRAAAAAGCRVANGLGMLLYQGARALEIWAGQAAPLDVMRQALETAVYGR